MSGRGHLLLKVMLKIFSFVLPDIVLTGFVVNDEIDKHMNFPSINTLESSKCKSSRNADCEDPARILNRVEISLAGICCGLPDSGEDNP